MTYTIAIKPKTKTATNELTKAQCLQGIPKAVADRLDEDNASTPLLAARDLMACLWATNPLSEESGEHINARIVTRSAAIDRAIAWYLIKGGDKLEQFTAFLEKITAPATKGDGMAKHSA